MLSSVAGLHSVSVENVTFSHLTMCTQASHSHCQLTCHSSRVAHNVTAGFLWLYCHSNSTHALLANGTVTLELDPTLLEAGVYSCVVQEDGTVSIFLCTNNSKLCPIIITMCICQCCVMHNVSICSIFYHNYCVSYLHNDCRRGSVWSRSHDLVM